MKRNLGRWIPLWLAYLALAAALLLIVLFLPRDDDFTANHAFAEYPPPSPCRRFRK